MKESVHNHRNYFEIGLNNGDRYLVLGDSLSTSSIVTDNVLGGTVSVLLKHTVVKLDAVARCNEDGEECFETTPEAFFTMAFFDGAVSYVRSHDVPLHVVDYE